MENKTIAAAENLLDNTEDLLLWSKGPIENFKPHFKSVEADTLFEDIKKYFSCMETVKISFENPDNLKINTDENYLKTIMRNLTENSVKTLEINPNASILWKAWKEKGNHYLSITDNGPSGTQEQFKALYDDTEVVGIKTVLGLHLIRDLSKAIDCEITVESKPGNGTIFKLSFK